VKKLAGALAFAYLAAAAPAYGDGLPVLGVDAGPSGVTVQGNENRYVAVPAGRDTLVASVQRSGGQIRRSRLLRGNWTIPAVAQDGSASGLSADGTRLVLIAPRASFPRSTTEFALIDTSAGLRFVGAIRLRGDYSFDAISPDGRRMYLIHYLSARDFTRYDVVSYDTRERRLEPRPIVDPREPDEKMRGYPLSRASSADGRWAYTLYDGAGGTPFVHALDTRDRTAACIDLDSLAAVQDRSGLRLRVDSGGRRLVVANVGTPVAFVETGTWKVSSPARFASDAPTNGSNSGLPWALLGLGAGLFLVVAGLGFLLFRRRLGRFTRQGVEKSPIVEVDAP
jgi:hypothetical protein